MRNAAATRVFSSALPNRLRSICVRWSTEEGHIAKNAASSSPAFFLSTLF
jgi:hypothetical protein